MTSICGITELSSVLQSTAAHVLDEFGHASGISCVAPPRQRGPVYGHWMGLIMLANGQVRVTLKVFYSTELASRLAHARTHRPLGSDLAHDLMREYLNLTGGLIKRCLEDGGIDVGLSLPLVTRGADELFAGAQSARTTDLCWSLESHAGSLVCRAAIEVIEPAALEGLSLRVAPEVLRARHDELEFL